MSRFLVVAASSTIGSAITQTLKQQGFEVITTARNHETINPDIVLDASDFDAVDEVFKTHADIDGVVNCSGSLLLKSAHLTTKEQYEGVIKASLTTAFALTRAAGKHMTQSGKGGSVVLISSAAALGGFANHEAIAAAKAGIVGLTLSAAATYAGNGLRFNAIAPGLVETRLTSALTQHEASRKISESMHALGRLGTPQDIANAACFLLDPSNSWITGQVLAVDGGLSRVHPKIKV